MRYDDQHITIMGLGRFGGGLGAARYLAERGATVTVTDLADADRLRESLRALKGVPIERLRLGEHVIDDFTGADLVVVNPAVHPGNAFVEAARAAGVHLTTEIELFMTAFPGRIAGVTGTNGKSTTTAMTAHVLRETRCDGAVWLGGNLGGSLLADLDRMRADDIAVLELSSFQLHHLGEETRRPDVAIVTGVTPNHLNWHVDFADYMAAKQRILARRGVVQHVVCSPHASELDTWRPLVHGDLINANVDAIPTLRVPGEHNRVNAACAIAAAEALGVSREEASRAVATCEGLPMRLQVVATKDDVRYVNDSSATTPESVIAALESIDDAWLLCGGASKGADVTPLIACIVRRAKGVAFYGAVRDELLEQLRAAAPDVPSTSLERLDDALVWCAGQASPGDAIVLSPGFASLDQFKDYRDRGEAFSRLARRESA